MRALTLWRPWAGLIAAGIKDVENRSWPAPKWLVGERLAIHAGKRWDARGSDWAFERLVMSGLSPVVALVLSGSKKVNPEGIVAVVRVGAPVTVSKSLWFVGRYGWPMLDVVRLAEPVPCRGVQGLWNLPPDVERAVLDQVHPAECTGCVFCLRGDLNSVEGVT